MLAVQQPEYSPSLSEEQSENQQLLMEGIPTGSAAYSGRLNNPNCWDDRSLRVIVLPQNQATANAVISGLYVMISDATDKRAKLEKTFNNLSTSTVGVRHDGEAIVLEPLKPKAWPAGFFDSIHVTDPTFSRPDQGHLPPVKPL